MSEINKHLKRTITSDNFTIGKDEQGKPKIIEGYFIVFDTPTELNEDEYEMIAPQAVNRSLNEEIKALIDHDSSKVLGRTGNGTLKLTADNKGLYGVITINENDSEAMNLYERVKREDVYQCSFAFFPVDETVEMTSRNEVLTVVKDMVIAEVSVVTFPAYTTTMVKARSHVQFSAKVKEDRLKVRKKAFTNKYKERLKELGNKEVDHEKVKLRTAKIIKDIFLEELEHEKLSENVKSLLSKHSRNANFYVRQTLQPGNNMAEQNTDLDEEIYKRKKAEIRENTLKLETRLNSHVEELKNAVSLRQLKAEESNIEKVIELLEKELEELEIEEKARQEYIELLKEANRHVSNEEIKRGLSTPFIFEDMVSTYLQTYVYETTGEDIVERTKYDEQYNALMVRNAKGDIIAQADDKGKLRYLKTTPKKVRSIKGDNKMMNNLEIRRAINLYVKSRGQERSSLTTTSAGVLIPSELVYNPEVKVRTSTDLKELSNVIEVNSKRGSHPIPVRSKAKLATVAELEANPALAKPEWLPVSWEVDTYRGSLPISQEAIDDAEIDLVDVVLENARETKTNTTNEKIAEVYKTFKAKSVSDIDGIKSLINIDLPAGLDVTIVASQSFYHELDTMKDLQGRYLLQPDASSPSGKSLNGQPVVKVEDELLGAKGDKKAFIGDTYRAVLLADRLDLELGWFDYHIYGRLLAAVTRFHAVKADDEAGFFVTWEPEIQA